MHAKLYSITTYNVKPRRLQKKKNIRNKINANKKENQHDY